MAKLSVKECLSFGWKAFRSRPWIFIGAGLVVLGAQIIVDIGSGLLDYATGSDPVVDALVSIFILLLTVAASILIGIGTINFLLKAHDDVKGVALRDLWAPQYFLPFLLSSVLVGLMVLGGLILLIIPGIILGLALFCVPYLVIDQNMGVRAAIKRSFELTKGNRLKILLLGLAIIGLNIVGALALLIGLVVTIPMSYLAYVHAYRSLKQQSAVQPDTGE